MLWSRVAISFEERCHQGVERLKLKLAGEEGLDGVEYGSGFMVHRTVSLLTGAWSPTKLVQDTRIIRCNFSVNLSSLGLEHLETEFSLYDHSAVSSIKAAVLNEFTGPVWTRLEVGKARKLHVHALAFEAPKSQHSTKQVHDLEGIALYLSKLQVPGDDLSIGIFLEAQKQARAAGHKRLPKTSFQRGIPTS